MEDPYDRKKRKQGAVILISWAHMEDNPVRLSQFPSGGPKPGRGLPELLNFY